MYKNLSIVLLLLALLGVAVTRSNGLPPSRSTAPAVVAKVVLQNQTAAIPTTTVYTPTVSGLYRVSAYMTVPVANDMGNGWYMGVGWTDEVGLELAALIVSTTSDNQPPIAYGTGAATGLPGVVILVQAVAGQPITYYVNGFQPTDNGTYSLYFTVERLI